MAPRWVPRVPRMARKLGNLKRYAVDVRVSTRFPFSCQENHLIRDLSDRESIVGWQRSMVEQIVHESTLRLLLPERRSRRQGSAAELPDPRDHRVADRHEHFTLRTAA